MKKLKLVFAAVALAACAPIQGYAPVVDFSTSPAAAARSYSRDLVDCRALAEQRDPAASGLAGATGGAIFGAIIGAIIGSASGQAGSGAGYGASLGGVAGGAQGLGAGAANQRDIVIHCMRSRGWNVVGY